MNKTGKNNAYGKKRFKSPTDENFPQNFGYPNFNSVEYW